MFNLFRKKQVITTFENSKEKYIEIKNVGLISSEVIETKHIKKVPTGKNIAFNIDPFFEDVLKSSHIIVGGCTGAGKSVAMNYLLSTALSVNNSEFIIIDNKNTSFKWCKNIPLVKKYAVSINDAQIALLDALDTITNRYREIENNPFLEEYNGKHLYIFVDELADLLTVDKKKFLPLLQRILQIGRGARVHVIVGSQYFTKDIIGSLKNNFTCKIGLTVENANDSRTLINSNDLFGLSKGFSVIRYNTELHHKKIHYTTIDEKKQILDFFNVEY